MIKIIAKNYSQAVAFLCDKLSGEVAEHDLLLSQNRQSIGQYLQSAVNDAQAVVLVGNVGDWATFVAEKLGLAMFYDTFAQRNVEEYCRLAGVELPPRHIMDKLCIAPEGFNHFSSAYGYQCACYGEYRKCHLYLIPDDARECNVVYQNYFYNDMFKGVVGANKQIYKVFGLSKREIDQRLATLNRIVNVQAETSNLDSKIVLTFPPKCAKSVVADTLERINHIFGENIYAKADQSLAKTVVDLLKSIGKTLSTAESITGGLIASSIVDVAGSSSVLYEGAVTYSIPSKCARLGISPHFVDEYGVVSQQVAQQMAVGLRKNGSDVAISTTGYAGPTADNGMPVGLCYVGIATEHGVSVYKNVFVGDRNSIRSQVANMALYLVYKTITK